MFNIFNAFNKKNKKMKILIVVNKDVHEPIDYYSVVDTNLEAEIRSACNSLAIEYDDLKVQAIANELMHGGVYCLNNEFGFQLLEVNL